MRADHHVLHAEHQPQEHLHDRAHHGHEEERRDPVANAPELLEDRALPSVFVVTNTLDAGDGSLRQAITDSNATSGPNRSFCATQHNR